MSDMELFLTLFLIGQAKAKPTKICQKVVKTIKEKLFTA